MINVHFLYFVQGVFDGKTHEEIEKISPEHYKAWLQDNFSYRFPNGEVNFLS